MVALFARVPWRVYIAALLVALGAGGVWWHGAAVERAADRAYQQGVTDTRADAAFAVAIYTEKNRALGEALDSARANVDTVVIRARSRVDTVRQTIAAIPVRVRDSVPEVRALIVQSAALADDVERITALRVTERAAYDVRHVSDSTMIAAASVTMRAQVVQLADMTHERDRRVTKSRVVVYAGAALGVGIAIGHFLIGNEL